MNQASNLRACYRILEDRVTTALQTRIGDHLRLGDVRDDALAFEDAVNGVSIGTRRPRLGLIQSSVASQNGDLFSETELALITSNIRTMVKLLDEAKDQSIDPPTAPPPPLSLLHHTGVAGRPRIEIDPTVLSSILSMKPKNSLARMVGCSARTVRRRQLEVERQTGEPLTPNRSTLSDDELDALVAKNLEDFPHFGRNMLIGAMAFQNINVPERRVRDSLERVRGAPGRFFGSRPIHRRKYYVPAANSLWHHDGQHGLLFSDLEVYGNDSYLLRIDPLEDRHPWFHRWKDTVYCWPQGP